MLKELLHKKLLSIDYGWNFNEDRRAKSTTGIHFFMIREEGIGYL